MPGETDAPLWSSWEAMGPWWVHYLFQEMPQPMHVIRVHQCSLGICKISAAALSKV